MYSIRYYKDSPLLMVVLLCPLTNTTQTRLYAPYTQSNSLKGTLIMRDPESKSALALLSYQKINEIPHRHGRRSRPLRRRLLGSIFTVVYLEEHPCRQLSRE